MKSPKKKTRKYEQEPTDITNSTENNTHTQTSNPLTPTPTPIKVPNCKWRWTQLTTPKTSNT